MPKCPDCVTIPGIDVSTEKCPGCQNELDKSKIQTLMDEGHYKGCAVEKVLFGDACKCGIEKE